jgi:hypothetical protein
VGGGEQAEEDPNSAGTCRVAGCCQTLGPEYLFLSKSEADEGADRDRSLEHQALPPGELQAVPCWLVLALSWSTASA